MRSRGHLCGRSPCGRRSDGDNVDTSTTTATTTGTHASAGQALSPSSSRDSLYSRARRTQSTVEKHHRWSPFQATTIDEGDSTAQAVLLPTIAKENIFIAIAAPAVGDNPESRGCSNLLRELPQLSGDSSNLKKEKTQQRLQHGSDRLAARRKRPRFKKAQSSPLQAQLRTQPVLYTRRTPRLPL